VRLLLDTHALLWFVWGHSKLSLKAEALMRSPDSELLLSTATYWEIAIKLSLNKLRLADPYEEFMDRAIADNDLTVLPITVKHAAAVAVLPFHHRDPFDRLLVAQAMVEQVPILSNDALFDAYSIARLW
jgi:PIN domain nuclease of toxin-antitoxin system